MTVPLSPTFSTNLQPARHLASGDRVWILTGVECFDSAFYPWSTSQRLFRVGVLDLATNELRLCTFGRDIASAMLKAGLPPLPWKSPQKFAIELHRRSHGPNSKGRYITTVSLVEVEPKLQAVVPVAKKAFADLCPSAQADEWNECGERAERDKRIETAALTMTSPFTMKDICTATGDSHNNVVTVIKRLVREQKLVPPVGAKRPQKYEVAPPKVIERADWND